MENAPHFVTHNRKNFAKVSLVFGAVVIVLSGIGLTLWLSGRGQSVKIPDAVVRATKSPIYLPKKLPGNYTIAESSFSLQENDVVMFWASDGAGGRIAFTEQPRPQDFDFNTFYQTQMAEAKHLEDAHFTSVLGKAVAQKNTQLLSVVTDETWLLVSTESPVSEEGWRRLTNSLRPAP